MQFSEAVVLAFIACTASVSAYAYPDSYGSYGDLYARNAYADADAEAAEYDFYARSADADYDLYAREAEADYDLYARDAYADYDLYARDARDTNVDDGDGDEEFVVKPGKKKDAKKEDENAVVINQGKPLKKSDKKLIEGYKNQLAHFTAILKKDDDRINTANKDKQTPAERNLFLKQRQALTSKWLAALKAALQ
jgi:hypothetical protein